MRHEYLAREEAGAPRRVMVGVRNRKTALLNWGQIHSRASGSSVLLRRGGVRHGVKLSRTAGGGGM